MVGRLNRMSAIRKKNLILLQQCWNTFNKGLMCLIWVSGMYTMPWVCFHMHVGVILSRFQWDGTPWRKKIPFGTNDGNDRNWKQITSPSGLSSPCTASRHQMGTSVQMQSWACCGREVPLIGSFNLILHGAVFEILLSFPRWFIAAEIWRWSILWYEEKGSMPPE